MGQSVQKLGLQNHKIGPNLQELRVLMGQRVQKLCLRILKVGLNRQERQEEVKLNLQNIGLQ